MVLGPFIVDYLLHEPYKELKQLRWFLRLNTIYLIYYMNPIRN